jgi:hypothetical protein
MSYVKIGLGSSFGGQLQQHLAPSTPLTKGAAAGDPVAAAQALMSGGIGNPAAHFTPQARAQGAAMIAAGKIALSPTAVAIQKVAKEAALAAGQPEMLTAGATGSSTWIFVAGGAVLLAFLFLRSKKQHA